MMQIFHLSFSFIIQLCFYFPPEAGKYINRVVCQSVSQSVSLSLKTMKALRDYVSDKPDTLFFSRQFMIYHLKTTMSGKNLTLRNFSTFFST